MPNPPYSASVLIIKENQDGFAIEIFHWDDLTENANIPPRGDITHILAASTPSQSDALTFRKLRYATSRADLKNKFGLYVDAKFPDTA